ncbi:hypothetical protein R5R35_001521 [Gryllus longicercus]|uniref:Coilin n=1 Tax=Gryllus longicercus TaxID=2509291 RepID=A0AAN9ZGR1_9ORTH
MSYKSIPGVRIVLDLELFFKDKRRKCYHFIDFSRNKIVRDVCNDIKSTFDLNTDIFLEINQCYIPKEQDVRILYNEDVVRVIGSDRCAMTIQNDEHKGQRHIFRDPDIFTNSWNDQINEGMDNPAENESDENIIVSKPKKRKKSRSTDETKEKQIFKEVIKESKNLRKKRKSENEYNIKSHSDVPINKTSIVANFATNLLYNIPTEHKMRSQENETEPDTLNNSTTVLTNFTSRDAVTEICDDTEEVSLSALKPEKKAVGIVCNSTVELPSEQTLKVDPEGSSCVPSASIQTNIHNGERQDLLHNNRDAEESERVDNGSCKKRRRRKRCKPSRSDRNCFEQHVTEFPIYTKSSFKAPKHIKFEDEEEEDKNSNNNTKLNVSDNNALDNCVSVQPSEETDLSNTINRSSTKNEYNMKSNSDVPINNNSNNFVIQTSTTPMIFECKRTNRISNNQSESKETDTDFSKYPLLKDAPRVNDIIAFRKLKMGSDYCPSISHYISAKVLKMSENDSTIMLRILNGYEELKEPKGKFSLEEENEVDGCDGKIVNDIEMNLPELLDTRLLFP